MSEIENRTYDVELLLHSGTIAADGDGQVGGADKILDLGSTAKVAFDLLIRISAIEIASNDELYKIVLEGSNSATFASGIVNLVTLEVGALEALTPNVDVDSTTGVYVLSGTNVLAGTEYRYLRIFVDVTGTIATGITFEATLHKRGD